MRSQRPGFTLVELLVGILISTVLITAAYQALVAQNRSYRATDAMVQGQDALRIALGVLESELQEAASIGGSGIGGIGDSDIFMASPDSIRIRAPRKLAFVCTVIPSDKAVTAWSRGAPFAAADLAMVFVDEDITTFTDDRWEAHVVSSVSNSNAGCPTSPTGVADQKVTFANTGELSLVSTGAPLRGFEEVSYGLYSFDGEWGLGRRDSDGVLKLLVGGLAGPGEGLTFQYYDPSGSVTTDREDVESMEISLRTAPRPGSGVQPMEVTSTIHLRNQ